MVEPGLVPGSPDHQNVHYGDRVNKKQGRRFSNQIPEWTEANLKGQAGVVAFGFWVPWGAWGRLAPIYMQTMHLVSYQPTPIFKNPGFFLHLCCSPEIPHLTQQEDGRGREKMFQVFGATGKGLVLDVLWLLVCVCVCWVEEGRGKRKCQAGEIPV